MNRKDAFCPTDDSSDERPYVHHWRAWRQKRSGPPEQMVRLHSNWHGKRRVFFLRMLGVVVLMFLLILSGMATLALLLTRFLGGNGSIALLVWIGGCGLAIAFPLLALAIAAQVFRRYAVPLADIMEAADEVAAGCFDVRVPERGSPDFRRLAGAFNRMTAELDRIDRQRRNLAADVAHELRTPLHILQGNLEGILDGIYEPSPEHIEATLQETHTLARLVDDLRTLSLAESGQLPLFREAVDINELLADLATSYGPLAEAAGIQMQTRTLPESDHQILGDPDRLDQVFGNLLSNAVRHTKAGGQITLAATLHQETILITVTDTGEGIAAEDLPFVFDRFWRGDRARTHSDGAGSGLGLAIASQLVSAHDGDISVSSRPGEGSTFTVELPLYDGSASTPSNSDRYSP